MRESRSLISDVVMREYKPGNTNASRLVPKFASSRISLIAGA